jgi:hypothetical protein
MPDLLQELQAPSSACGLISKDFAVDVDHVAGLPDPAVRPNQILAVGGLPHQVLVEPYGSRVIETGERRLLTPFGLRSHRGSPATGPTTAAACGSVIRRTIRAPYGRG